MKINEILNKTSSLLHQKVDVEGFFMYSNDYVYVAPSDQEFDRLEKSLQILEVDFLEKVRQSDAPAAGGWISSYPYNIVIEGTLCYPNSGPFKFAVTDIQSAYLEMDGETYHVK
jgi:hypothetical protein